MANDFGKECPEETQEFEEGKTERPGPVWRGLKDRLKSANGLGYLIIA